MRKYKYWLPKDMTGKNLLAEKRKIRRMWRNYHISQHKRVYNYAKKLDKHGYFLDCNYKPAKITELNFYDYDVSASEVNGLTLDMLESIYPSNTSCSLIHCAPEPITKKRAYELITVYMNNPLEDYMEYLFPGYKEKLNNWNIWEKANPKWYELGIEPPKF